MPVITLAGVGPLRLGVTARFLQRKGLIGHLGKGCEGETGAPLRRPLRGWAFFESSHGRLIAFTVEGGAETRRLIGIGTRASEALRAYPDAFYEPPGTAEIFREGFLWVPNRSEPKLSLSIDPETRRVMAISIPSPPIACENPVVPPGSVEGRLAEGLHRALAEVAPGP